MIRALWSLARSKPMELQGRLATGPQISLVNMIFNRLTEDRNERLAWLGVWFQRDFSTSKDLTLAEAWAIIECSYMARPGGWDINPDFEALIFETKEYLDSVSI